MTLEAWVNPSTLGGTWRTVVFKQQQLGMTYALYGHNGADPVGQVNTGTEQNTAPRINATVRLSVSSVPTMNVSP